MQGSAVAAMLIAVMAVAQPAGGRVTPAKGLAASRCPGWFRADQYDVGRARVVWTVALEDKDTKDKWWPAPGSRGVHVAFASAGLPVRSLELSVTYLPSGTHSMPIDPKSASESKKSYSLITHERARVEGDLLVGPAAMITSVHLISATFADESVWHAANESACSVEPNLVIPSDGKESSLKW